MKPLYNPEEFNAAKSRQKLPLECKQCGGTFWAAKVDIQRGLNPNHHAQRDFCSNACKYQYQDIKIDVVCLQCKESFKKHRCETQTSPNHFCSSSCACTYHNAHKTTGTRRSKLEVWLEAQLRQLHPTWDFHFNRKDTIDSELDIYIPHLKLAFELNGIFHYEPIYGQNKLDQIQNNDQRKFAACIEKGIGLCIIDSSKLKYFKESKLPPFLKIIEDVILIQSLNHK